MFSRSRVALSRVSSADRQPLQAQLSSKSAEIVAEAKAPPRNGVIWTPLKQRAGGGMPGAKFFFKRKMLLSVDFLIIRYAVIRCRLRELRGVGPVVCWLNSKTSGFCIETK